MPSSYDHWTFGDFDRDPIRESDDCVRAPAAHVRLAMRRALGRDVGPTITFKRPDTGRHVTMPMNTMDPILLLAHSRKFMRSSEHYAEQYGEVRQRVVSPVMLP